MARRGAGVLPASASVARARWCLERLAPPGRREQTLPARQMTLEGAAVARGTSQPATREHRPARWLFQAGLQDGKPRELRAHRWGIHAPTIPGARWRVPTLRFARPGRTTLQPPQGRNLGKRFPDRRGRCLRRPSLRPRRAFPAPLWKTRGSTVRPAAASLLRKTCWTKRSPTLAVGTVLAACPRRMRRRSQQLALSTRNFTTRLSTRSCLSADHLVWCLSAKV